MRIVKSVLTFFGVCGVLAYTALQAFEPTVLLFPAVMLGVGAYLLRASYLSTIGAIATGLTLCGFWEPFVFRVMPGPMFALMAISDAANTTRQQLGREGQSASGEVAVIGSGPLFSGIGVGILLFVVGLLLSAKHGEDPARRATLFRAVAIGAIVLGTAALFGPRASFGFGVLMAAVPGAFMVWKSVSDTRATLRVLRETW